MSYAAENGFVVRGLDYSPVKGPEGNIEYLMFEMCIRDRLLADYVRTLCEEAGADTLAWCAGLAGRCLVLAAVWPLLEQIFQTIWGLAG